MHKKAKPTGTYYETLLIGPKGERSYQRVPRFRYNWRVTNRSKYSPHQGAQEMSRRVAQRQSR